MAKLVLSSFNQLKNVLPKDILKIGESVPIPKFAAETLHEFTKEVLKYMNKKDCLVRTYGPAVIVGDIHGNIYDLFRIMIINGFPPQTKYVFLGDYVDRGEFSVEVVSYLLALYVIYPAHVFLIRGNHEFRKCNATYGFKASIMDTYNDANLYEEYNEIFDYLPLAALINDNILCVHGGISSQLESISQIDSMELPIKEDSGIVSDIVWSDPDRSFQLFIDNIRGKGCKFGQTAFEKFRTANNLAMLIRGHQCVYHGIEAFFNQKLITVFSSSSYSIEIPNLAGFLNVNEENRVIPTSLPIIPLRKRENTFFFDVVPQSNCTTCKCLSLKSISLSKSCSKIRFGSRVKLPIVHSKGITKSINKLETLDPLPIEFTTAHPVKHVKQVSTCTPTQCTTINEEIS